MISWAIETFGPIASDKEERVKRFAEEAIELCQACGLGMYDITRIAVNVYIKPSGNINQETGQAALSLALLAEVNGIDVDKELQFEFDRVQSFDKSYWQARQNLKAELGIASFCD